jgi:16S rRNA (adenine1518-N6/adenine1519-N6)-dimethyltransferase
VPEPLRDVIARHGLQATKALGQNFILDRQLLAFPRWPSSKANMTDACGSSPEMR